MTLAVQPAHITTPPAPAQLSPLSPFVDDVRESLYRWHTAGLKTALLTLINYEGSSPRPIGSQVVVNEYGHAAGLISGSCLETNLIVEAMHCIRSNTAKLVRYGKDSDYLDITLPCGSGLDVLITPNVSDHTINHLYRALVERQPVALTVDTQHFHSAIQIINASDLDVHAVTRSKQLTRKEVETTLTAFTRYYGPLPRTVVVGEGAIFDYFLSLSQAFDGEVIACSPRFSSIPKAAASPMERLRRVPLHNPAQFDAQWLDAATALVLLSHNHDWDTEILQQALKTPVRYLAALGSPATHARRIDLLQTAGVTAADCARIKGPAGLDLGGRTPPEIALSILAEITQERNRK